MNPNHARQSHTPRTDVITDENESRRKLRVPKGEPWGPEIFVVELGAQSFSRLGARTKMLFLAKWSPGVNCSSWSPGALYPFGTLKAKLKIRVGREISSVKLANGSERVWSSP